MSISRDENTRAAFTRCEAIPRPVATIDVFRDICGRRLETYYGPVEVITDYAQSLVNAGVALHGVTHLTPSQVGVDIANSLEEGRKVFSVNRFLKKVLGGMAVYDVKVVNPTDVIDFGPSGICLLDENLTDRLGLRQFARHSVDLVWGWYYGSMVDTVPGGTVN